jgi:hypothetical protein
MRFYTLFFREHLHSAVYGFGNYPRITALEASGIA